jgi:hypothetical protein
MVPLDTVQPHDVRVCENSVTRIARDALRDAPSNVVIVECLAEVREERGGEGDDGHAAGSMPPTSMPHTCTVLSLRPLRYRTDKLQPNSVRTVVSALSEVDVPLGALLRACGGALRHTGESG